IEITNLINEKVGIGTFNIDNIVSNQLNDNISFEHSNNKQLEIQN
ncbi:12574_t:CDS:1, partial [Cetraspora pellucida]